MEEEAGLVTETQRKSTRASQITNSAGSSMGCCSAIYLVCCFVALGMFYLYYEDISLNCRKDLYQWWVWSLFLNFFPPLLGIIVSCLAVCTGCVNYLSFKKHDPAREQIGTSTKLWNAVFIFVVVLCSSVSAIVILATYVWLILGTIWVADYHESCLSNMMYGITIYWLSVQYLFLTFTVLGIFCGILCVPVAVASIAFNVMGNV